MHSNILKFVEMPSLGIYFPISENDSENSLVLDSSAESRNESTMLSSASSQNLTPEQVTIQCQDSTESQNSQVPVEDVSKSQSSSDNSHKPTIKGFTSLSEDKKYRSSPLAQLHPSLNNESSNHRHLTSCHKRTSNTKERSQQLTNYIDSQVLELSNRGAGSEFVSPVESCEPSTESEKLADCGSSESKVVVQAMPNLLFGDITALQQCSGDIKICRTSKSSLESGASETGSRKSKIGSDTKSILKAEISKLPGSQISEDDDFQSSSYHVKKIQLNHAFNFHIQRGRGKKLSDINYIASAIPQASSKILRLVHYLLFGSYGGINTESALEKTKANILHFSGFGFNEVSETYNIKLNLLTRIPYSILLDMHVLLVGKSSGERSVMVKRLLKFCLKPTRRKQKISNGPSEIYCEMLTRELKKRILEGSSPVVKLERLSEEYIQKMIHIKDEDRSSEVYDKNHPKKYIKPRYIVNGPGMKLKTFPQVVEGVYKARRRIINLLHVLLFGRPGSNETNRLNILEFNGFLQRDKFLERGVNVLNQFKREELEQICNIFCLYSERDSKVKKIKKLLLYLQTPSLVLFDKRSTDVPLQAGHQTTQKLMMHANDIQSNRPNPKIPKLRNFEKICFNIECAPPGDLAELNDLLFIKPCDVTEIHEKLLDFTSFPFDENSLEFQYRKTLLHYMGLPIIKKIAQILDIPSWDRYQCEQELSMIILKFLMKLEKPVMACKRVRDRSYPGRKRMKKEVPNSNYRPQILRVQKDMKLSPDHRESNNCVPPGSNNSVHASNGFHESEDPESCPDSTVVIQRISESSYSWTDLKNNAPITISNVNSDESLPLHEFAHHPTENQLEVTIKEVICSNSMSNSLGDLLNKVLQHYPRFNLTYRTDFIKSKALEILHEIQGCMVDSTLTTT